MSEDLNNQDNGENPEDKKNDSDISNLKAEFDRKMGNISQNIENLSKTNEVLLQQLQSIQTPVKKEPEPELDEDLMYSNPAEYKRRLKSEILSEVNKQTQEVTQAQAERQQTIVALGQQYPEIHDANSELYKKAVEAIGKLPANMQASSIGYKTAVYQAAAELGLPPQSSRQSADPGENFSVGMSKKGTSRVGKKQASDPEEDFLIETAAFFGKNVKDKDYVERLKKRAKRTNWTIPKGEND